MVVGDDKKTNKYHLLKIGGLDDLEDVSLKVSVPAHAEPATKETPVDYSQVESCLAEMKEHQSSTTQKTLERHETIQR